MSSWKLRQWIFLETGINIPGNICLQLNNLAGYCNIDNIFVYILTSFCWASFSALLSSSISFADFWFSSLLSSSMRIFMDLFSDIGNVIAFLKTYFLFFLSKHNLWNILGCEWKHWNCTPHTNRWNNLHFNKNLILYDGYWYKRRFQSFAKE